jgi:hypothetical protein
MSVKLPQGAEQAIAEEIAKGFEGFNQAIVDELNRIGTEAVTRARRTVTEHGIPAAGYDAYKVRTANLVSSIGFALAYNGKVISISDFEAVQGEDGTPGTEGSEKGKAYAKQLVMQCPQGYALILVAGMHYASYVQELHNRDVLVSGQLLAESLLRNMQRIIDEETKR